MKRTAIAPANIALIKYWGKKDAGLRIPTNSSISMNLSGAYTTTTVEFSDNYNCDTVTFLGEDFSEEEKQKVIIHLDRIRKIANSSLYARVLTKNSFPRGAGIASSASGFAALTIAACAAISLSLSEKELTVVARLGSGSACRSIPNGFVKWVTGDTSQQSIAYTLYPATYWDLRDIVVIIDSGQKKVSTTNGMESVSTSPLWPDRLSSMNERMLTIERALASKNFVLFGETIEEECLNMHNIMQTQIPPLMYWTDETRKMMKSVQTWRKSGLPVYFTIDAGPNIHLFCEAKDEALLAEKLKGYHTIVNGPSEGAYIAEEDLF